MWDDFVLFVAVGFAAQLVDGAIGMAYGLSGTTVMLSLGFPPATASASVHAAEAERHEPARRLGRGRPVAPVGLPEDPGAHQQQVGADVRRDRLAREGGQP